MQKQPRPQLYFYGIFYLFKMLLILTEANS